MCEGEGGGGGGGGSTFNDLFKINFLFFYTKSIQFIKIGPQCVHVWLTIRTKLNYLEKMKDTKIFMFK